MTNQVNLDLVWASGGGSTDPGDTKYQLGWISEIPTYQNFNFVLGSLDGNIKANAEKGNWDYEATITYQPGASVRTAAAGIVYYCHAVTTGNEPTADTNNNYWSTTPIYGVAPTSSTAKRGFELNSVSKTITTWEGQDVTVANAIPLIAFETSSVSEDNWLLGNLAGDMVVVDAGTVASPDSRNIAANAYKIFHEGHLPLVSEVVDAVEEAPVDGKSYARTNSAWTEVTSTKVQAQPAPTIAGAGQGWYNLDDGQLYIDVNDGNSSQWVPANPPQIPISSAIGVAYDDSVSGIGTNVQTALDTIAQQAGTNPNMLINGGFDIWQRGTSFTQGNAYTVDRFILIPLTGTITTTQTTAYAVSIGASYVARINGTANTYYVETPMETPADYAGQTFTHSFWLKIVSGGLSTSFPVNTNSTVFGVDYQPTGETRANGWVRYSATVTYAEAISSNISFRIDFTAGSDVYLGNCKLERGSVATPFESRPIAEELALCQRYYQDIGSHSMKGKGVSTFSLEATRNLTTTMRTAPAMSFTASLGTNHAVSPMSGGNGYSLSGNGDGQGRVYFTGITADAEM